MNSPSATITHRTIASFDIGIKNMAYCVASLDSSNQLIEIKKWGIINMIHEPPPPPICCYRSHTIKSSPDGKCENRATLMRAGEFYCKKHVSCVAGGGTKAFILGARDIKSLKKKSMEGLKDFIKEHEMEQPSSPSLKKQQLLEHIEEQISKRYFIPAAQPPAEEGNEKNGAAANDIDLITVGRIMKSKLDEIFDAALCAQLTDVFIENQIGSIAMRMKTIQGMLTQYFIFVCPPELQIKYISASLKLKGHANRQTTYKERKTISIEVTEKILNESSQTGVKNWSDFFKSYGIKRDDLADSFLQLMAAAVTK